MAMSESAGSTPPGRGRSLVRMLARLLVVLLLGAIVAAGLLVLLSTQGMLTGRFAKLASDNLGRPVSLGDARIGLGTPLTIHMKNVTVGNPPGMAGADLLQAEGIDAKVALNWTPPFTFDPTIDDVTITSPVVSIQEDAAGKTNLDFGATDSDKSGLAVWPPVATVTNGKLTYAKAGADEPVSVEAVEARLDSDAASGKTTGKGKLSFKGETVDFDATFADLRIATTGLPTAVDIKLTAPRLTAHLAGDAVLGADSQFTGAAKAETPSLTGLARWINPKSEMAGETLPASLDGTIRARGSDIGLTKAAVDIDGTKAVIDGTLALAGERPKLTGTVAMPTIDLTSLSGPAPAPVRAAAPQEEEISTIELIVEADPEGLARQLKALETGTPAPPRAAPDSAAPAPGDGADEATRALKATTAKPAWSVDPIEVKALRAVDLDIMLTADTVAYGNVDIKNARIKTQLENGRLAADIEDLDVSSGKAKGKIALDASGDVPSADVALDMTAVAAEPIVTQFTGKPFLSGQSNAEIRVKAAGANPNALASSLEGSAKFKMGKGAFRGIDVRREADNFCLSELFSGYIFGTKKVLSIDLKQKTNFETLDAEYKINKGILKTTPGLALEGDAVAITSRGEVSVARKLVDQNVRLTVVPPPKLPTIPVDITGSWSKVNLKLDTSSVDWIAVLNSLFLGCKAPRSLAPDVAADTPPVPAVVREAIEGVLNANIDPSRLSDEGKSALRSLIGAEEPAATPEPSAAPAAAEPAPANETAPNP